MQITKYIPQGVTRVVGRQLLTLRKDSPKILFALGIVGTVGSTFLACRATLKLEETLDEFKDDVAGVKTLTENIPDNNYTRADHNKDMAYTYLRGSIQLVKLYGPAVILGAASLGALTGSHVTLTRRNSSLTAAYTAVQASYNAYRERVKEELGEEKELDIYHATKSVKANIDGKVQQLRLADPNKYSPYAKIFDEFNPNWVRNSESNRMFIQCQQNWFNHLLHARGHVFLNEVYNGLGFKHTSAGQIVGWVLNGTGDNFIDFGLYEAGRADFINGYEQSRVLDFNVDGPVWNLI